MKKFTVYQFPAEWGAEEIVAKLKELGLVDDQDIWLVEGEASTVPGSGVVEVRFEAAGQN